MRRAIVLSVLLLTVGLAGCLGQDDTATDPSTGDADASLSPKLHDILPVEVVRVESSLDGTELHNAVYRPDTDEPVPVFVNFSPYWGDGATERGDAFSQYMIQEYVPRGYAVVLSAIRGTGHSNGCFQIAGDKELQDVHDVVDHFAGASWSNGNVAAGGKSYDSTSQNGMIAKVPHEALKGIFHVSGITDMYRYNYRMGVPYAHGTIFNTYYYNQGVSEYALPVPFAGANSGNATYEDEDADSLARAIDDAACPELPLIQAHGVASGASGQKTDYWIERDWNRYVGETGWNGSIFFVHGLQDWNVKPDHILPWLTELPDQVQVKAWLHQDTENLGHVYPMRADWNATMLAWMDHVLKGKDTGVQHDVEVEGSDGVWRTHATWPPSAQMRPVDLALVRDDPGLTQANKPIFALLEAEAGERLRYAGAPSLTVTATSQSSDPVLTAILYEVDEDGELEWTNEAVLRGIYRGGLEEPEPVPVGEPVEYELPFYPQDDVLEPGHRWVVALGGMPEHAVATQAQLDAVTYDAESATAHLPLVSVGPNELAQQPDPIPCFAC